MRLSGYNPITSKECLYIESSVLAVVSAIYSGP